MISPLAVVADFVQLGDGCEVHPFAILGRLPDRSAALARMPARVTALRIGARTAIGPHSVVYGGSDIGKDCLIGDHAMIREGCRIGDRCVIGRSVMISYDCEIADDCRFQDGTVLTGRVGRGCFFGVGVITSNDRNINLLSYRHNDPTPPWFGEYVMVGSGANILAGVRIGDGALIGAGAVVIDDVPPGGRVLGPKAMLR